MSTKKASSPGQTKVPAPAPATKKPCIDSMQQGSAGDPNKVFLRGVTLHKSDWDTLQRKHPLLKVLHLHSVSLVSEVFEEVVVADIQHLDLQHCTVEDNGKALTAAIKARRGPKEIALHFDQYHSKELFAFGRCYSQDRLYAFLHAVGSSHLQSLSIARISFDDRNSPHLIAAMQANTTIQKLKIEMFRVSNKIWEEFLGVLSLHPSMQEVDLGVNSGVYYDSDMESDYPIRYDDISSQQRTKAVANMLAANPNITHVELHSDAYDQAAWNCSVMPLLEKNSATKQGWILL